MSAPMVAQTMTSTMFISPLTVASHAAGGTMTSEGKGMKELSMAIKTTMTQ